MLINLSNHASNDVKIKWPESQMEEALRLYKGVKDVAFPQIGPTWAKEQVVSLAAQMIEECVKLLPENENNAIHIMGEMTFTYAFVNLARQKAIVCVASTRERPEETTEKGDKETKYKFIQFREYY